MPHSQNLISTLDQFNAAVYLKNIHGHYLSMNSAGLNFMSGRRDRVLGKTAFELFDTDNACKMMESDHFILQNKSIYTSNFNSYDKLSGTFLPMQTAKTSVRAPSGEALGIIGISLVNYNDSNLFSDACKLLPQFILQKHSYLLHELLELRTVSEFLNLYQLH